ncbi:acyl transferase/acyl hydrolase/lysophospholipase [Annulohypoxylon nitens]|nr:acyl transferase/acyl hydrolase/lysophospholipase [Annulohypoxylon nitens]
MLGRLRMTVGDCITAYTQLSSDVFKKRRHRVNRRGNIQGRFDSSELEKAVRKILTQQGFNEDALLKDTADAPCKVFVCTRSTSADKVCLTSYRSPRGGSHLLESVKIWEACRATSAAPSFFDPITIGPFEEEFVDGALGENNPIYSVWNQAQDIWNDGPLQDKILCLISIGTGVPSLKPFQDGVLDMGKALVALSTESEETAERFHQDKATLDNDGRYYRFNVIRGLEVIGLQESERKKEIAAATLRYITSQAVFNKIKACAEKMLTPGSGDSQIAINIETTSLATISFQDPLTLMSSTLGVVNRAVGMLRQCQQAALKARIPTLFIVSLITECSAIRLGLIQIQTVISKVESDSLEEIFREDILEEYNSLLGSCHMTFYILNKHMSAIRADTSPNTDKFSLRLKLQALSENHQMDQVSRTIMGLARGVRIICTAFEDENFARATAILGSPETKRIVASISSDSVSLQDSFHNATDSIETDTQEFEYDGQSSGIDDLLINTTLYRRAFVRNLMRSQQEEIYEHPVPGSSKILAHEQSGDAADESDSAIVPDLDVRVTDSSASDQEHLIERDQSLQIPEQQLMDEPGTTIAAKRPNTNGLEAIGSRSLSTPSAADEDLEHSDHAPDGKDSLSAPGYEKLLEAEFNSKSTLASTKPLERLPTLSEILTRRAKRPLDIAQHMSLCRAYVRELREMAIRDMDKSPEETDPSRISRESIRASAEKIVYTFLLPGAEREIVLPGSITRDVVSQVEEFGRDDPEVFDMAKDYVFQAMERDAYPGFMNLSRPPFRIFRGSKSIGPWINRVALRGKPQLTLRDAQPAMQRIPPHELLDSLNYGKPGAPHV